MYAKKIKYTDYDGNEREEIFYFNLSASELTLMELSETGGLKQKLEAIVMKQDVPKIIEAFRDTIHRAYGEKSADGKRFIKSEELVTAFEQTPAYDELFLELCYNSKSAAEFVNRVLPSDLEQKIKRASGKTAANAAAPVLAPLTN